MLVAPNLRRTRREATSTTEELAVSDTSGPTRPRVAVVGSGVAGLTAAYLLRRTHDVTVFERADRLGGHAHTHEVADRTGRRFDVDTGFIVHNDRTYPLLRRLFAELGVPVRPTEMSMSIGCDGCGLEYAGGRGLGGVLAQPRRLADRRFRRLLAQVRRFQRHARELLAADPAIDDDAKELTYGDFLARHGFDPYFVQHYAVPVVSCVWSSGHRDAMGYPARYLFRFLDQHGFLSLHDAPQWYTVGGGSQTYVRAVADAIGDVRPATQVRDVTRKPDGVEVRDAADNLHVVDHVVVATHADEALQLLTDPTDDERRVLGAFTYSRNQVVLHTDAAVLPRTSRARAAWNYRLTDCGERQSSARVAYWMNRLQGLDGAADTFVVSVNDDRVDAARVLARMEYTHPVFDTTAVAAQAELDGLATDRTVFAGAHHGWGFHEDGCRSGVTAAEALGARW